MLELMQDCRNAGLAIASGIVGIGLLALLAQVSWFVSCLIKRLRASRRKPVIIEVFAPEVKYLPRP